MKQTRLQQMQKRIQGKLDREQGRQAALGMEQEYEELCRRYDREFAAMETHIHNNIFPVVAAARALQGVGLEREEAVRLAGDAFLELMEESAVMLRRLMKLPGLYRLMPWLWKTLMPKLFSEENGFRFRFAPTDGSRVKFDMLECPYYRICCALDCQDLAPVFCASDDICYGKMHPKLIWNRTMTIARGADRCDFDLYIPPKH